MHMLACYETAGPLGADKKPTEVLTGHRGHSLPADDPAFAVSVGMVFDQ